MPYWVYGAISLKYLGGKLAPKPAYFVLERERLDCSETTLRFCVQYFAHFVCSTGF